MQDQQEQITQKIMSEIHRYIQKLKEDGMAVDSTLETITSLVDGTVKYTDKLTLTGNIEKVRFDTRTPEEVKIAMEAEKTAITAQQQEVITKLDGVIAVIDAKPAPQAK